VPFEAGASVERGDLFLYLKMALEDLPSAWRRRMAGLSRAIAEGNGPVILAVPWVPQGGEFLGAFLTILFQLVRQALSRAGSKWLPVDADEFLSSESVDETLGRLFRRDFIVWKGDPTDAPATRHGDCLHLRSVESWLDADGEKVVAPGKAVVRALVSRKIPTVAFLQRGKWPKDPWEAAGFHWMELKLPGTGALAGLLSRWHANRHGLRVTSALKKAVHRAVRAALELNENDRIDWCSEVLDIAQQAVSPEPVSAQDVDRVIRQKEGQGPP